MVKQSNPEEEGEDIGYEGADLEKIKKETETTKGCKVCEGDYLCTVGAPPRFVLGLTYRVGAVRCGFHFCKRMLVVGTAKFNFTGNCSC